MYVCQKRETNCEFLVCELNVTLKEWFTYIHKIHVLTILLTVTFKYQPTHYM